MQRFCTESSILAYADFKATSVLHTDANRDGLGAVLYQVQEGQKRVITYASQSLSGSERNYPVHKLEFLALKWAITDKFHEYLYGSGFQLYTDKNLLTYVLTMAKLDATGHRWVAALSNYTFNILYKPGKGHLDTDTLSHIKWPEAMGLTAQTVQAVCEDVQAPHGKIGALCHEAQVADALAEDNVPPGLTPIDWCHSQAKDPAINQIVGEIKKGNIKEIKNQDGDAFRMEGTHQN